MPAATTLKLLQIMGLGHPTICSGGKNTQCYIVHGGSRRPLFLFTATSIRNSRSCGVCFLLLLVGVFDFCTAHLAFPIRWHTHRRRIGCMATQGGLFRLFLCGFLLGLAGMLRLQYAPVAGLLGLIYLLSLPPKRMPFFMLGGMAAVLSAGCRTICFGKLVELLFSIHSDCPCHRVSYRRPAGEKFFLLPVFANAVFFQLGVVCMPFCSFRPLAMA